MPSSFDATLKLEKRATVQNTVKSSGFGKLYIERIQIAHRYCHCSQYLQDGKAGNAIRLKACPFCGLTELVITFAEEQETLGSKSAYSIACIAGDGIGKEVLPEGVRVLDRAASLFGFGLDWIAYPWSCEFYSKTGAMMPANGLDQLAQHDAIFLGAVGFPGVPDHISLWGLLLPIRRRFNQYVNLRPIRLMPGMASPLANAVPGAIDFLIVRENTEGEYSDQGEILHADSDRETVVQQSIFTRTGVDRIFQYGFELASRRKHKLAYATKSNGIFVAMPYWDGRAAKIATLYPSVAVEQYHIDILSAHFVRRPESFDVVVASNLMGDILSDLGAACTGTIGVAPSANLNPEGEYPSMFEPVHGSAPDIFGKNIANPIGQIWSGAMMLEHLGQPEAARAVMQAIEDVMVSGPRTPDMGGASSTQDVGRAIEAALMGPNGSLDHTGVPIVSEPAG